MSLCVSLSSIFSFTPLMTSTGTCSSQLRANLKPSSQSGGYGYGEVEWLTLLIMPTLNGWFTKNLSSWPVYTDLQILTLRPRVDFKRRVRSAISKHHEAPGTALKIVLENFY